MRRLVFIAATVATSVALTLSGATTLVNGEVRPPVHHRSAPVAVAPVPTTTTTTTVPAPPPTTTTTAPPGPGPDSCAAAIAYLRANANPIFSIICPGYAYGHPAMTCQYEPAYGCAGQHIIVIADPCPAAYENEAANSWIVDHFRPGPLDPFGECQ